jgi:hypothetical protein
MGETRTTYFNLDTVALLREALDDACAHLRPSEQRRVTRSLLAGNGECDHGRLLGAAFGPQQTARPTSHFDALLLTRIATQRLVQIDARERPSRQREKKTTEVVNCSSWAPAVYGMV